MLLHVGHAKWVQPYWPWSTNAVTKSRKDVLLWPSRKVCGDWGAKWLERDLWWIQCRDYHGYPYVIYGYGICRLIVNGQPKIHYSQVNIISVHVFIKLLSLRFVFTACRSKQMLWMTIFQENGHPCIHFEYPACISPVHHARFYPDIHRYPMKQVITQLAKINKFELMAHNLERGVNYPWVIHGSP
jgi:hypothetical protein